MQAILQKIYAKYFYMHKLIIHNVIHKLHNVRYRYPSFNEGIRSDKRVVRRFRRGANMYLQKPRSYSLLHTKGMWYSLLLLGYKPVQHVTVLNTVENVNTMVSIIILYSYGSAVVYAVRC